jgi:hypothetical protein
VLWANLAGSVVIMVMTVSAGFLELEAPETCLIWRVKTGNLHVEVEDYVFFEFWYNDMHVEGLFPA